MPNSTVIKSFDYTTANEFFDNIFRCHTLFLFSYEDDFDLLCYICLDFDPESIAAYSHFGGESFFRRSGLVSEETLCANRKLIIQKVDE